MKQSESRMGGEIIAALRVLFLKSTLQKFIKKPQFLILKRHKLVVIVLQKKCVWDFYLLSVVSFTQS